MFQKEHLFFDCFRSIDRRVYKGRSRHFAQVGSYGERVAARFLIRQGYKLLARNYKARWGVRPEQEGEIDMICRHGDTLVFIEVKTMEESLENSRPAARVYYSKQRRIIRCAYEYVRELFVKPEKARFDIVEIYLAPGKRPHCVLLPSAFVVRGNFHSRWG